MFKGLLPVFYLLTLSACGTVEPARASGNSDPSAAPQALRQSARTEKKNENSLSEPLAKWEVVSVLSTEPNPKIKYRAIVLLDTVDEFPLRVVIEKIRHPGGPKGEHLLEWSESVDLDPMVKEILARPLPGSGSEVKESEAKMQLSDAALNWSVDSPKWSGLDFQFQLKQFPRKSYRCEIKDVPLGSVKAICK